MNRALVYKLVHEDEGLYSFNAIPTLESAATCVEYKTGEWTFPKVKNTPLFAFTCARAAEVFLHSCFTKYIPENVHLYEARADVALRFSTFVFDKVSRYGAPDDVVGLRRAWRGWIARARTIPENDISFPHWALCGKIKLLKQV